VAGKAVEENTQRIQNTIIPQGGAMGKREWRDL
jgi:hypothetical protein